jgi:hypothetical protein
MINFDASFVSQVSNNKVERGNAEQNVNGVSFLDAVAKAVNEGKVALPEKTGTDGLNFNRSKLTFFEDFEGIEEGQEKIVKQFLARIKRILEEKYKK